MSNNRTIKMCCKCFNKQNKCNCKDSSYMDIDINIADIISILNIKGYYTVFCCEGHLDGSYFSPYICFAKNYNIKNLPSDLYYDNTPNVHGIYRKETNIKKYKITEQTKKDCLNNLYVWAKKIKSLK